VIVEAPCVSAALDEPLCDPLEELESRTDPVSNGIIAF